MTKPCARSHNPQFWRIGVPKLCVWGRNPQFQSADMRQPWALAAILNSGVPTAPNLRFGRKNEIMRMISIFWKIRQNQIARMISIFRKISKSGATAVRPQSLTFYAPPRDSIAIPASLMRVDKVSKTEAPKINKVP